MRRLTTLLTGAGALVLASCSDAAPDGAMAEATGEVANGAPPGTGQVQEREQFEATSVTPPAADPATPAAAPGIEAPARGTNRAREGEPSPNPKLSRPTSAPPSTPDPSPTPTATCAPEHRELGHC